MKGAYEDSRQLNHWKNYEFATFNIQPLGCGRVTYNSEAAPIALVRFFAISCIQASPKRRLDGSADPISDPVALRKDTRSLRRRRRLARFGMRRSRLDILILAEEICRIVFSLDCHQTWQIGTEGGIDDVVGFHVERGKKMRVR
jgi:hypothetical protein